MRCSPTQARRNSFVKAEWWTLARRRPSWCPGTNMRFVARFGILRGCFPQREIPRRNPSLASAGPVLLAEFQPLQRQQLPLRLLGKIYVWKIGVNSLDLPVGLSLSFRCGRLGPPMGEESGQIIVFRTSVVNAY